MIPQQQNSSLMDSLPENSSPDNESHPGFRSALSSVIGSIRNRRNANVSHRFNPQRGSSLRRGFSSMSHKRSIKRNNSETVYNDKVSVSLNCKIQMSQSYMGPKFWPRGTTCDDKRKIRQASHCTLRTYWLKNSFIPYKTVVKKYWKQIE